GLHCQPIDGVVILAGHRGDFLANAMALANEKRPDQIGRIEGGLTDEAAQQLVAPQSSEPRQWKRQGSTRRGRSEIVILSMEEVFRAELAAEHAPGEAVGTLI